MTPKKADKEFCWMLEETHASEVMVESNQTLMGDACKELRKAHGIPRNAVAGALRTDSMEVSIIERSCTTDQAKHYRAAVQRIVKGVA